MCRDVSGYGGLLSSRTRVPWKGTSTVGTVNLMRSAEHCEASPLSAVGGRNLPVVSCLCPQEAERGAGDQLGTSINLATAALP